MPFSALLVAFLALLAATTVIVVGRHADRLTAEREAAASAADAVTVVAAELRSELTAAGLSAVVGQDGQSAAHAVAQGIAESALTVARDSGRPVLDDSGAGIVVARYRGASVPPDVQERRDQVAGYDVVPLDLAPTLKALVPSGGGITVSGPDRKIWSVPATGPGSAASFSTSLGPDLATGWTITVWTTSPRTPTAAWMAAITLLVLGLAVASWVAFRQRDSRRRRLELRGLQQTSATVAEVATLAQHSLDLGDVLPAVATELVAALGLRGLSLSVPTALGERPLFVMGVAPDPQVRPQERDEVDAGATLAMVLSRGGRVVATLRVTAGQALGPDDVRTLVAAGDVLTSALANAELFAQQSEVINRMRTVDQLKTVFLATASHELRTPVVTMAGYANLLHSNWDVLPPDAARGYAERIDSIAQRLNVLVEDILDFSRLQSGKGPGATDEVLDLADEVGRALDELTDVAPDHEVRYQAGPGLPVTGSRQAVDRVVVNLVGNAAKYSGAGSTIRVSTRELDGRAELVVEDEGPGIPLDQREQVFSPFFRGSGDEVVRTRGAGLGLAIVVEFAASMSGRARVEESASGGARFVVSYPLLEVDPLIETKTEIETVIDPVSGPVNENLIETGGAHVQA